MLPQRGAAKPPGPLVIGEDASRVLTSMLAKRGLESVLSPLLERNRSLSCAWEGTDRGKKPTQGGEPEGSEGPEAELESGKERQHPHNPTRDSREKTLEQTRPAECQSHPTHRHEPGQPA